jgi:hypothetical protein
LNFHGWNMPTMVGCVCARYWSNARSMRVFLIFLWIQPAKPARQRHIRNSGQSSTTTSEHVACSAYEAWNTMGSPRLERSFGCTSLCTRGCCYRSAVLVYVREGAATVPLSLTKDGNSIVISNHYRKKGLDFLLLPVAPLRERERPRGIWWPDCHEFPRAGTE